MFELAPKQAIYTGDDPEHEVDYMALFSKPNGGLVMIAITVKPTEEEIKGVYPFKVSELEMFKKSNIPVLMLVIDVKRNQYFLNWANNVIIKESANAGSEKSVSVLLRHGTPEVIQQLKQEIMNN